jgi:hypothetical protein
MLTGHGCRAVAAERPAIWWSWCLSTPLATVVKAPVVVMISESRSVWTFGARQFNYRAVGGFWTNRLIQLSGSALPWHLLAPPPPAVISVMYG